MAPVLLLSTNQDLNNESENHDIHVPTLTLLLSVTAMFIELAPPVVVSD